MTPTQEMIEAGRRVRERQRAERYQNEAVASDQSVDEEEARELYLAMEAARLQSGSPVSEADVERVARAIDGARGANPDELILPGTPSWVCCLPEARAVVAALQAPAAQPTGDS